MSSSSNTLHDTKNQDVAYHLEVKHNDNSTSIGIVPISDTLDEAPDQGLFISLQVVDGLPTLELGTADNDRPVEINVTLNGLLKVICDNPQPHLKSEHMPPIFNRLDIHCGESTWLVDKRIAIANFVAKDAGLEVNNYRTSGDSVVIRTIDRKVYKLAFYKNTIVNKGGITEG